MVLMENCGEDLGIYFKKSLKAEDPFFLSNSPTNPHLIVAENKTEAEAVKMSKEKIQFKSMYIFVRYIEGRLKTP